MPMQKTGTPESIEVLRGEEAGVLNKHMAKLGKYKVSDFSKEEREQLQEDLNSVRTEK